MENFKQNVTRDLREVAEQLAATQAVGREYEVMRGYAGEDRVVSDVDKRREITNEAPLPFYKTNIPLLDEIVGVFREGQLVVVSGPTGSGKTSFCQFLTKQFIVQEVNCLWFTYEIGFAEFLEKMPMGATPFYWPKTMRENSFDWLEQRIVEGVAKYETRVVFIDHLHYLIALKELAEAHSVSLLVGMLMRKLKRLAIRHGLMIFLVSHLRKTEMDRSRREEPEMDDLRDSSFTAQESDLILMIWRLKEKINGELVTTNDSKIAVRKNRRTGKLGFLTVAYLNGEFTEKTNRYEQSFPRGSEPEERNYSFT